MNKYKSKVSAFKNEFNLINSSEEELLEILKKNNFDFKLSFQYLININTI